MKKDEKILNAELEIHRDIAELKQALGRQVKRGDVLAWADDVRGWIETTERDTGDFLRLMREELARVGGGALAELKGGK